MTLRTRVEPIDQDIALIIREDLSPQARSKFVAQYGRQAIGEARQGNARILGRDPRYTVKVDGREGAALESVKPDGEIFAEFELFNDLLRWIDQQLTIHSPKKSGRYLKSHTLFADGVETEPATMLPAADEFVFISTVPYARKIERGASSQAPDGVYQVVATLAQRRFGNVARITFAYRTAIGGAFIGGRVGNRSKERNPAIIVRLRG